MASFDTLYSSTVAGLYGGGLERRVAIVEGVRTPLCRAGKGALKDVTADRILAAALEGLMERVERGGATRTGPPSARGVGRGMVDDVVVGNVLQPGAGAATARMAALSAGIKEETSVMAVNRQCSSGLQALASVAGSILLGQAAVGIAAGVESMSQDGSPMAAPKVDQAFLARTAAAADCMVPMGVTSDNVAKRFHISRAEQDAFALASHAKATAAQTRGLFAHEIVPVVTARGSRVDVDDGVRADCSAKGLGALRAVFSRQGTSTAGNSSQRTDGAAALLVMTETAAAQHGLRPKLFMLSYACVGVPPHIMGVGPALAIPAALERAGLALDDIDVFEINEAFASQCLYCIRALGIPDAKVNPLGGAIALGHPLGATGTRQVVTLMHHLRRTGQRYGVVSMCVGTGMGAAAVFENPDFSSTSASVPSSRL